MSERTFTEVTCDREGCGAVLRLDGTGFNQKGYATAAGWIYTELEDVCPRCQELEAGTVEIFNCTQMGGRMVVAPNGRDYECLDMKTCRIAKGSNPRCHLLYKSTLKDYAREAWINAMWKGV